MNLKACRSLAKVLIVVVLMVGPAFTGPILAQNTCKDNHYYLESSRCIITEGGLVAIRIKHIELNTTIELQILRTLEPKNISLIIDKDPFYYFFQPQLASDKIAEALIEVRLYQYNVLLDTLLFSIARSGGVPISFYISILPIAVGVAILLVISLLVHKIKQKKTIETKQQKIEKELVRVNKELSKLHKKPKDSNKVIIEMFLNHKKALEVEYQKEMTK